MSAHNMFLTRNKKNSLGVSNEYPQDMIWWRKEKYVITEYPLFIWSCAAYQTIEEQADLGVCCLHMT